MLEKALQKRPEHRYATALELAEELGRVRARQPIRTRPAGPLLRLRLAVRRQTRLHELRVEDLTMDEFVREICAQNRSRNALQS